MKNFLEHTNLADNHPAFPSTGPVLQVLNQLRKSFPAEVSAETLKKLGLAGSNESRLINIFKFVGIIDDEGKKTAQAGSVFSLHNDVAFESEFSKLVEKAYTDLFELHGQDAWILDKGALISYFRHSDQPSAVTGSRQAIVFQALASLSGHIEMPIKPAGTKVSVQPSKPQKKKGASKSKSHISNPNSETLQPDFPQNKVSDIGLTVRIEINLPTSGDQETYDRIFKSIRQNLINAE